MRNKKSFLGLALIVAIVVLGVGYATVNPRYMKVTGTAGAAPDDTNFNVHFDTTATPTKSSETLVTVAEYDTTDTNNRTAKLSVAGFTKAGESAYAIYTVINESNDITANLSAEVCSDLTGNTCTTAENGKIGNFSITTEVIDTLPSTNGSNTTTLKVTVTLDKTPTDAEFNESFSVLLTASPEGSTN